MPVIYVIRGGAVIELLVQVFNIIRFARPSRKPHPVPPFYALL